MKNKEAKKWRSQEVEEWRSQEWRSQEAKNEEPQEAKNQELQEPQEPHKINFKYFTIFNTSLFYKPFSTTSKSI